jgi:hypothetical protein
MQAKGERVMMWCSFVRRRPATSAWRDFGVAVALWPSEPFPFAPYEGDAGTRFPLSPPSIWPFWPPKVSVKSSFYISIWCKPSAEKFEVTSTIHFSYLKKRSWCNQNLVWMINISMYVYFSSAGPKFKIFIRQNKLLSLNHKLWIVLDFSKCVGFLYT